MESLQLSSKEYSYEFDRLRKNRAFVSQYKYGSAEKNYGLRLVNALNLAGRCIQQYKDTGNTEYLCDAGNYIMFEFMYPQRDGAHFKPTNAEDNAGMNGISFREIEALKSDSV